MCILIFILLDIMIYWIIWYTWYVMIYHLIHMICYTCYDMTWLTWHDMIWYDMIWYDMIWYDMIWRYTGYHDMHADVQVAVIRLPYLVSWEVEFPVLVQYRHNIKVQQQRRKGKQRRKHKIVNLGFFFLLCQVWTKDKMTHKYNQDTRREKTRRFKTNKTKLFKPLSGWCEITIDKTREKADKLGRK